MSTTQDSGFEELRDRLADQALRELLGNERPPDVSASILRAASFEHATDSKVLVIEPAGTRFGRWRMLAIAACLLVGTGLVVFLAGFHQVPQVAGVTNPRHDGDAVSAVQDDERVSIAFADGSQDAQATRQLGRADKLAEELAPSDSLSRRQLDESQLSLDSLSESLSLESLGERDNRAAETADPLAAGIAASGPEAPQPNGHGYGAVAGGGADGAGPDASRPYRASPYGRASNAPTSQGVPPQSVAEAESVQPNEPRSGTSRDYYAEDRKADSSGSDGYGAAPGTERGRARGGDGDGLEGRSPARPSAASVQLMVEPRIVAQEEGEIRLSTPTDEERAGGRVQRGLELLRRRAALSELARTEGLGAGQAGDRYGRIHENSFVVAQGEDAVSTFSIDVDTASYANVRQFLLESGQLPPPDAVRIEEMVNYFDYDYSPPTDDRPFAASIEIAGCPWQPEHRLVRVGIKGRELERRQRPLSNLVFLVDVSGSMNQPNKLPLVIEGLKLLAEELGENDRVAIVVYASAEGLALPSTSGEQREEILQSLDRLRAGGSTAGGAGIQLAYQVALDNFIEGGTNRVVLCTDGDFNVGVTDTPALERLAERNARTGVFLTVLGFGRGNLNDQMMESISNKGNGNYYYVDNLTEAGKVLVAEMTGTLVTIAKDVKIQIEFNPGKVAGYRLIGYENRLLATEDFNDDTKDAGEIGAGHTVTALYQVVPVGTRVDVARVDELKYQRSNVLAEAAAGDELLTLKLRYKQPTGDESQKIEFAVRDEGRGFGQASTDFKFAAAVASFGMLLRDSQYSGNATLDAVAEIASDGARRDPHGYREEFLEMVRRAKELR